VTKGDQRRASWMDYDDLTLFKARGFVMLIGDKTNGDLWTYFIVVFGTIVTIESAIIYYLAFH
jgi:hypothetical protein